MITGGKLYKTIFSKPLSIEMSGEMVKFFSAPTTKQQPCKMFAKLN